MLTCTGMSWVSRSTFLVSLFFKTVLPVLPCTESTFSKVFSQSIILNHYLKKQNNLKKTTRNLSNRRELGRTPCHTITNHAKSSSRVNNHILNIHFTGYINSSSGAHTCPHTANQISFRRSVCSSVTEVGFAYVM